MTKKTFFSFVVLSLSLFAFSNVFCWGWGRGRGMRGYRKGYCMRNYGRSGFGWGRCRGWGRGQGWGYWQQQGEGRGPGRGGHWVEGPNGERVWKRGRGGKPMDAKYW